MREQAAHPHDPHWDLTLEIAGKLWLYGEHVLEIDAHPTQKVVDLQWAARQAGRLIGVRTHLDVSRTGGTPPRLIVRVTYDDPDGQGLVRAQDGLDALVRSVQAQQVAGRRIRRRRRIASPRHHGP